MLILLLNILLLLCGLFLILIVLIQRGKGGGLAGAFGGMGGHSAFGTRAGDKLMKITIGVSGVWILLAMVAVLAVGSAPPPSLFPGGEATPAASESKSGAASGTRKSSAGVQEEASETKETPAASSTGTGEGGKAAESPSSGEAATPSSGDSGCEPKVSPKELPADSTPSEAPK